MNTNHNKSQLDELYSFKDGYIHWYNYSISDYDTSPFAKSVCYGRYYRALSGYIRKISPNNIKSARIDNSTFCFRFIQTDGVVLDKEIPIETEDELLPASPLTLEQITEHIKYAQRFINFDFKLIDKSADNNLPWKIIEVEFNFKDLTFFQIKYVTTWSRYIYNFPYNIFAFEIYNHLIDIFPEEIVENLFGFCGYVHQFCDAAHGINGIFSVKYTLEEYQKRIESLSTMETEINMLHYPKLTDIWVQIKHDFRSEQNIKGILNEDFKKREDLYKERYINFTKGDH